MSLKRKIEKRKREKMSDMSFKMMTLIFKLVDLMFPYINRRLKKFGIKEGMTVIDYGCGPGRYSTKLARLVGPKGKVYAVDIHEVAIEVVKRKIEKHGFNNIEPLLIKKYNSTLPDNVADVICAIDMFFVIKKPAEFLAELKRILKKEGTLIIDDGHQSRSQTKAKILSSGLWSIYEETRDHLKCRQK